MIVVTATKSNVSGATTLVSASPTGGSEVTMITRVATTITRPSTITTRSSATPARLLRKIPTAIRADSAPPSRGSIPSMASVPSPLPATLPMLKTRPPTTTRPASR